MVLKNHLYNILYLRNFQQLQIHLIYLRIIFINLTIYSFINNSYTSLTSYFIILAKVNLLQSINYMENLNKFLLIYFQNLQYVFIFLEDPINLLELIH